jgi:hypothetical protein
LFELFDAFATRLLMSGTCVLWVRISLRARFVSML